MNEDAYAPRHNATPGAPLAVLRCAAPSDDDAPSSPRAQPPPLFSIETMRWGLVPAFTPPTSAPDFFARFNARSESARDKASFRRLVPARRCVALLDGFYEWTALGTHSKSQSAALGARSPRRTKQPWLVRPSSDDASSAEGVMYVAGLWDEWVPSADSAGARADKRAPVRTFTILTTAPAEGLAWLHDRQPVVLRGEAAAREWLRRGDRPDVCARLTRGTAEGLTSHMVSPAINDPSECHSPERGLRAVHAAQAHARGRRHPRLLQRGAVAQAASGRPRGGRQRAAGGGGGAAEARQARARALMVVL